MRRWWNQKGVGNRFGGINWKSRDAYDGWKGNHVEEKLNLFALLNCIVILELKWIFSGRSIYYVSWRAGVNLHSTDLLAFCVARSVDTTYEGNCNTYQTIILGVKCYRHNTVSVLPTRMHLLENHKMQQVITSFFIGSTQTHVHFSLCNLELLQEGLHLNFRRL